MTTASRLRGKLPTAAGSRLWGANWLDMEQVVLLVKKVLACTPYLPGARRNIVQGATTGFPESTSTSTSRALKVQSVGVLLAGGLTHELANGNHPSAGKLDEAMWPKMVSNLACT